MSFSSVFLLVTLIAGLGNSDPTECYYCSKGLSGCSDPVDITTATVCQVDSISESLNSIPMFEAQTMTLASASGATCTKLSMSNATHTETARFCSYKYVENEELCSYLSKYFSLTELNFTCLTCDTNLCNGF